MWIVWTLLSTAATLAILVLITAFICFRMAFFVRRENQAEEDAKLPIPEGEEYEPYREQIVNWINEIRSMPRKPVEIRSHDGLRLAGYFYEYEKGAPIEILFHGYRGNAERDLSGGVARCFSLGHSVLIVDQRAAGQSEGNIITFGVLESRDCLAWTRFVVENIDKDAKIVIGGISMGAATVLMASTYDLPENVVGVLADCGYTSAREIIKKVIREMKLPADLLYPFVKLGARIYGHFDLEEHSPIEAMKKSKLPVILLHGDSDDFVPHSMSLENFKACTSEKKRMVTISGAAHGLAFPADKEKYLSELHEFFDPILK